MTEWHKDKNQESQVDDPAVARLFKALPRTGPSNQTLDAISRAAQVMAAERMNDDVPVTVSRWDRIRELLFPHRSTFAPVFASALALTMIIYIGSTMLPGIPVLEEGTSTTPEIAAASTSWSTTTGDLELVWDAIETEDMDVQTLILSQDTDGSVESELIGVSEEITILAADISEF